MPRHASLCE